MPGGRIPARDEPALWATFLAQLWQWVGEHGDARVPTTTVTIVNGAHFNLGSRVKNARVYYHRGSLAEAQIAQLEALPGWSWNGHAAASDAAWKDRVAALSAYVDRYGSVAALERRDPSLGAWLRAQRSRVLPTHRRSELAGIPGALEPPAGLLHRFVETLTEWIEAVPGRDASYLLHSTTVSVEGQLVWLGKRAAHWRARYSRGELTNSEVARLDAVPGWRWESLPPGRRPRAIEQLSKA